MTLGTFFTTLAYVVGAFVFYGAARSRRLATEGIGYVALAGFCGGIFGAKLTEWALANWSTFAAQPASIFDPRLGGRTIIGGVLSGWIAVEIAKRRLGIRRSTGDLFALALPAGEAVGRIGCFFNGCCYGVPCHAPWAVYQHGTWRHPAQIYSSAVALLMFGILLLLRDKMPREGDLFKYYLIFFSGSRFVLEFFRERGIAFAGLSAAQWVCLEITGSTCILLLLSNRHARLAWKKA
jgi:phosphatidylglycerol---prolipoprotein diacylglyceryl transferase